MSAVVVVDYGAGNTRSVCAALERIGATSTITSDPIAITAADRVVLPGVGSARAAMEHLERTGAANALRSRFADNGPIVGICLGMQLALQRSEEDGGVATLGLIDGTVRRLQAERVPRLGWARVEPWGETYFFAHGFECESSAVVATSEGVTAAVALGSFFGVQFHPEKSAESGERWLASCLCLD